MYVLELTPHVLHVSVLALAIQYTCWLHKSQGVVAYIPILLTPVIRIKI